MKDLAVPMKAGDQAPGHGKLELPRYFGVKMTEIQPRHGLTPSFFGSIGRHESRGRSSRRSTG
jgi:hypothetical protein